jgi:class I fructose-bisphosphate aldolase
MYFDPENIVRLAIEGGCNAVASTFGVLGIVARKYAHKIPFIVKINHNELLTYPNQFDQVMFGTIEQASNMGAGCCRGDDLLWFRQFDAADHRGERGVCLCP